MQTEYKRLFGAEGVYTNAQSQMPHKTPVARSPYARLIEQLHEQGISIREVEKKTFEARLQIGTFLDETKFKN